MPAGRPSSYLPEYAKQAEALCKLGATDAELAAFFEVSTVTIWRWQSAHEAFCNALKRGKDAADERVERSLYAKATGYTFEATKIFMPGGAVEPVYAPYTEHVPPDTTACIFWLKNRRRNEWRDRQEHELTGANGGPIETKDVSELEAARRIAFVLRSALAKQIELEAEKPADASHAHPSETSED